MGGAVKRPDLVQLINELISIPTLRDGPFYDKWRFLNVDGLCHCEDYLAIMGAARTAETKYDHGVFCLLMGAEDGEKDARLLGSTLVKGLFCKKENMDIVVASPQEPLTFASVWQRISAMLEPNGCVQVFRRTHPDARITFFFGFIGHGYGSMGTVGSGSLHLGPSPDPALSRFSREMLGKLVRLLPHLLTESLLSLMRASPKPTERP